MEKTPETSSGGAGPWHGQSSLCVFLHQCPFTRGTGWARCSLQGASAFPWEKVTRWDTAQLDDAQRLQGQEGTEVPRTPWGPLETPELEVLQDPAQTSPTAIPLSNKPLLFSLCLTLSSGLSVLYLRSSCSSLSSKKTQLWHLRALSGFLQPHLPLGAGHNTTRWTPEHLSSFFKPREFNEQ